MRIRYAHDFKVYWFAFDIPLGYCSVYYDGWNNQVNFGIVCFCWMTPPLKSDKKILRTVMTILPSRSLFVKPKIDKKE